MTDDVHAQLQRDNLHTWLELELLKARGNPNQRERWAHQLLPDDELGELAREEFFPVTLMSYQRWSSRIREAMIKATESRCHRSVFPALQHHGCVDVEVAYIGELTADEWSVLGEIRDIATAMKAHPWLQQGGVEVETSAHWATCRVCGVENLRNVARVSVRWAGRELVREYLLQRKVG